MKSRTTLIALMIIMLMAGSSSLRCQERFNDSTTVLISLISGETLTAVLEEKNEDVVKVRLPSGERRTVARSVISSMIEITNTADSCSSCVEVEFTDGSKIIGQIVAEQVDTVRINTLSGAQMTIPRKSIRKIRAVQVNLAEGKAYRFDPNRTRLFFTTTGRSLRAGEGYFTVVQLFFPMLAIGLTDQISLAGGMSLIPGAEEQLFYGNLKYGILTEGKIQAAAGALYLAVPGEEGFGVAYGVGTLGNSDNALTVGLGEGFTGEDGWENSPILMLGGELRVSNSVKFITENWIPLEKGRDPLLSLGIRFFGESIAGDFGLFTTPQVMNEAGFPFMPWLGFAYNFGR